VSTPAVNAPPHLHRSAGGGGLAARAGERGAGLAFWVGNPALNPVVLTFCLFVLPWEWTVLRATAGMVLVAAVIAVVSRPRPATTAVDDLPTAALSVSPDPGAGNRC
jgi:uncharacterized membrane protein YraQ (UPF0718 family)